MLTAIGISQAQVSRLEKTALLHMKKYDGFYQIFSPWGSERMIRT